MHFRDRIKRFCRVPASKLRPHPHNWKIHPPAQASAVRAALEEIGFADALLARELPDGSLELIDGHLRAELAPDERLPVLVLDVDEADSAKLIATLDPLCAMAETDRGKFAALMATLTIESEDLQNMLEDLAAQHAEPAEVLEDEIPAPPATARTKPGDLYVLGRHRLLCGDSSSKSDVDRLVGRAPVHLVNTDPPYNVKVEPRSNNAIAAGLSKPTGMKTRQKLDLARHPGKAKPTKKQLRAKDRPLANDFVTDEAFVKLLDAWFGNAARVLAPGRGFYIWGGYANCANYPPVLKAKGLYFSQAIIWVKEHPVLTRKDFMGNHEWCFYGWKEGAAHQFFGSASATDVWSVKKVHQSRMIHLTEKPVELAARAIGYSTRKDERVLDLFGGSGSTLIAAQQLGRQALLMELDPLYCDVIVERFEKFAGVKAKRERK